MRYLKDRYVTISIKVLKKREHLYNFAAKLV